MIPQKAHVNSLQREGMAEATQLVVAGASTVQYDSMLFFYHH